LREKILLLVELQDIDSEIKRIEKKKEELPAVLEQLNGELRDIETHISEERQKVEDLNARHKSRENDLRRANESLVKAKGRLFDVKTNKEYQALLKEMDTINERNDEIEFEIITILEAIDVAVVELGQREKEYGTLKADHERNIKKVEQELNSIDDVLLEMRGKSDEVKKKVDAELLKRYNIIRQKMNGMAVVPVWKEICGGCHVNIPPQVYNELQRSEEMILCPNCSRIMYWENRANEED